MTFLHPFRERDATWEFCMRISGTRIRNLIRHLAALPPAANFRVIERVDENSLGRIGFPKNVGDGETMLPRLIGPTSRFNAEGRWVTRYDLPKERRYIRTIRWRWTTWDGEEHEDFKPHYRECYQRDLIDPPAVELTYVEKDGDCLVMSPALHFRPENETLALHTINLFLEIFGSCEIVADDLRSFVAPEVKKVNWKLLPTGNQPWERIEEHIKQIAGRISEASMAVILDRQKTIDSFEPDERWAGEGGFNDYLAYIFKKYDLVILESIRRDNAIYAFTGDWRPVSQLSKAEIIQNDLHHARIVHSEGWKNRLGKIFHKRAA